MPESARVDFGTGKNSKTIIVRSNGFVSVFGIDNEHYAGDGFFVLPSSQLGTRYRIASYTPQKKGDGSSFPSFFSVSALANDETLIDFMTKSGEEYSIRLAPFESFRFDGEDNEDITGTVLVAGKPVAVLSGVQADIPANVQTGGDGLLSMFPPEESWGTNFVMAPYMERKSGYLYRVISTNQTTTLTISNVGTIQIQGNECYEGDVTGDTMVRIISDLPVMVVQYMKGFSTESPNKGDPSMLIIPPLQSFGSYVTFPVIPRTRTGHVFYINVIIDCINAPGLIFDDSTPMSGWNTLKTSDNEFCAVRGNVGSGVHSVGHSNPLVKFSVIIYNSQELASSYVYPAGFGKYLYFNR